MSNKLINNSIITKEALMVRRNTNDLLKKVNREYEDQFAKTGAKVGSTINVRLPNDYIVQDGATISPEATAERSIPLTINKRKAIPMSFSTQDRTMVIDRFSDRYVVPAVNALTGQISVDLMSTTIGASAMVANFDSSGKLISPSAQTWLRAKALLTSNNAPIGDRHAILDPFSDSTVVAGMMGIFNPQAPVGKQTVEGQMGSPMLGVKSWGQDQSVLISVTGSYDSKATATGSYGSYTATGAVVHDTTISSSESPHSSTLTVSAINGTLSKGDIITISGVHSINRVNKTSSHQLQQFAVLEDVPHGAKSIPVSPAIIPPSPTGPVPYQTVDSAPAEGAVVKLVLPAGTAYRRNFMFASPAITFACIDLEPLSDGVVDCANASLDGVSLRTVTVYDGINDVRITRLDALYGAAILRNDWVCIVPDVIS